jgi:hypothetical protein
MIVRRSAFSSIGTAVLTSALLLTPALSAEAAAPAACRGSSCTGKNPQPEGCGSGAEVIDRVSPAGGGPRVELRNSARCTDPEGERILAVQDRDPGRALVPRERIALL